MIPDFKLKSSLHLPTQLGLDQKNKGKKGPPGNNLTIYIAELGFTGTDFRESGLVCQDGSGRIMLRTRGLR